MDAVIQPARRIAGELRLPGDKSISHRYALLGAIAEGETTIRNYAPGADCASTLRCLAQLGVTISRRKVNAETGGATEEIIISGRGLPSSTGDLGPHGFLRCAEMLDAGNSGSTIRKIGRAHV